MDSGLQTSVYSAVDLRVLPSRSHRAGARRLPGPRGGRAGLLWSVAGTPLPHLGVYIYAATHLLTGGNGGYLGLHLSRLC